MSKSPHRFRGNPSECWKDLLFGEIVRLLDEPVLVRDEPSVKLPRSGHWESGLARIRPALDDALGSTALALAWRWASAEFDHNAWPGLPLVARKATDRTVTEAPLDVLARTQSGAEIRDARSDDARAWVLELQPKPCVVSVSGAARDWSQVDRIASVLAAWLDVPWHVEEPRLEA